MSQESQKMVSLYRSWRVTMEMLADRKYEIPKDCKFSCDVCVEEDARRTLTIDELHHKQEGCDCYSRFIDWVGERDVMARKEMTYNFPS